MVPQSLTNSLFKALPTFKIFLHFFFSNFYLSPVLKASHFPLPNSVLVIYYCKTNNTKINRLNNSNFIISHGFMGQELDQDSENPSFTLPEVTWWYSAGRR